MSHSYRLVQWNRHKVVYDLILAGAIGVYLAVFAGLSVMLASENEGISEPIVAMRAIGSCAFLLLHVALAIGPLARIDKRFAPLLYNRRHLGVATFILALLHAAIAVGFYGGFGVDDPATAVLARYSVDSFGSLTGFPFEILGFLALLILFVMAATSHDFWLANLGARVWKWIHMLVYVAYGLLVMHVVLGAMQSERSLVYPIVLGLGIVTLGSLHVVAGWREVRKERNAIDVPTGTDSPELRWIDIGSVDEIRPDRAKIVCLKGRERIAVFRHNDAISAVSNVCAHQGGPLGEGKIVDGCVTCPWHGYQYLPESGQSPPPYSEKVATYQVRVEGRRILVNPDALAPGTPVEPARFQTLDGGNSRE
ncbi:MAG: ferric reductase-like transmembrane domain-containing protein [Phycisphaeraceae bacterium]|nr:ferric reductase-like transmembrane domain-containing protein [Phycisphaeraceae bacterium]MBX3368483.1 ferric reductase-like transmembrane domain-containing protein [Phycisphaeraceae bacterium]